MTQPLSAAVSHPRQPTSILIFVLVTCALSTAACGGGSEPSPGKSAAQGPASLTLGAYTTPREAYGPILAAFKTQWSAQNPGGVEFKESYLASGAQARAIVGGFEADVAALSLEPDIEVVRKAGLITSDWKKRPHGGMVTRSIVVIGVREGNPKNIRDWEDLAKPGISVLTPNVRTSGGARWNIAAVWGAAIRGHTGAPKDSPEAASKLLSNVLRNVKNMDPGARESLLNFERGVGDAIITYENEILVGKLKGQRYDLIVPKSTILIENPAALVDKVVDQHGNRQLAQALLDFLITPEAQRIYANNGLRPVHEAVAKEFAERYPAPTDLFTIRDLGDWSGVQTSIFGAGTGYDKALAAASAP
jgi:sulfate/thiosulfate-binding protein